MADGTSIDLMGGGFTRGMLAELEQKMLLEAFSGHIDAVEYRINDGKEATVYLCRAPEVPGQRLAAKVYRDRRFRGFANNADYTDPSRIRDRRMAKAVRKGSRRGRREAQRLWVEREWEALVALKGAGASVPEPIDHNDVAVLMEFLGGETGAAPLLAECRLEAEALQTAWQLLRQDLALLLATGLVHGDLSPYNVVYHDDRPRMIDLPQAVDLDDATDGWSLLHRDVENIAGYFQRRGLAIDVMDEAVGLWERYAL